MIRAAAALVGAVVLLSACVYHNTIYNAQRAYDEADRDRRAGRATLAMEGYREVVRRTAEAYRGRPADERTGPTLFLLGRARLRMGELRAAREALQEAAAVAAPELRSEILVYLGLALAGMGDAAGALTAAEEAIAGSLDREPLAEAHLLRGRLRLAAGRVEEGWADLDRAAGAGPVMAVEAAIERVRWSLRSRDRERAHQAVARALALRAAGERIDTVRALMQSAAGTWGTSAAAALLESADTAAWDQPARGRIRLEWARLLRATGDTARASEQAWRVASGRDTAAAEARLLLARWRLGSSRNLGEAHQALPILLPAGDHQGVADLIDAVALLDRYASMGLDEPLGWFAAAELARDRLGAPVLARGLFMAYADIDPSNRWAPKALLAALDASPDEEDRAWLRGRLEEHRHSPYVLAAFGGAAAGVEALEEELSVRLREIRGG